MYYIYYIYACTRIASPFCVNMHARISYIYMYVLCIYRYGCIAYVCMYVSCNVQCQYLYEYENTTQCGTGCIADIIKAKRSVCNAQLHVTGHMCDRYEEAISIKFASRRSTVVSSLLVILFVFFSSCYSAKAILCGHTCEHISYFCLHVQTTTYFETK